MSDTTAGSGRMPLLQRDDLRDWLRLLGTDGIGSEAARRLLAVHGWPSAIFAQGIERLRETVSERQALALLEEPADLEARLQQLLQWLDGSPGPDGVERTVLVPGDPRYPPALLNLPDPPLWLYAIGRPERLQALGRLHADGTGPGAVAVVGSRNPTPQGLINARAFARSLAATGVTIVSGLALGIDAAAHQGALEAAGDDALSTVAVVGTGLDRVYPRQHLELARDIARRGVLLSEYPLGTPPLSPNFPRRNRIIAGLGRGTLVIEAALQSGSLITARLAAEMGREVFAIPGSIHAAQSKGCHALIKQGARLVEAAEDIVDELRLPAAAAAAPADGVDPTSAATPRGDAHAILEALSHEATSLEALQARTGLATDRLQAVLLELELDQQIARLPGGRFQRLVRA